MIELAEVEVLIRSSKPAARPISGATAILLGGSMLLGGLVAKPDLLSGLGPVSLLIPHLAMTVLILVILQTSRKQRQMLTDIRTTHELMQLRQWEAALGLARRRLARPVRWPRARVELLLAAAGAAESQGRHDAAQRIYEHVIEQRQADPMQAFHSHLSLAVAMLRTGQVSDGISMIDRLERQAPKVARPALELLSLVREVLMGQAADRADRIEERRGLFRHLFTPAAGYGYALLAVCCEATGRAQEAAELWGDATCLLPAEELTSRYPELQGLAGRLPATRWPSSLARAAATEAGHG